MVLCPPYTALTRVADLLRGTPVQMGAQNMHWEPSGAYTGEISGSMLKELGCRWCILGHSERRQLFLESDAVVQKKVQAALGQDLRTILCVGETLEQRKAGKTWQVVQGQLEQDLQGLTFSRPASQIVIAYEPIWAIGTGVNATPAQAQEMHAQIRGWLKQRFSPAEAGSLRILYGGSVKAGNALELLSQPDIDGVLVGGASLDPKAFASIVESGEKTICSTA